MLDSTSRTGGANVDGTFLYNLALFLHIGGVLVFAVVMAI
jgi:hypothetical protein